MATPFSEIVKEDLTCPLCYELFLKPHNPKDLDCPHVCCQMCLKRLTVLTEDEQRLYVVCPECRQTTLIPLGGIVAMKTNIRLRNLAEKHQRHQLDLQKASHIPICSEHEGETKHFYCITCKVAICQFCFIQEHQGSHEVQEVRNISKQKRSEMIRTLSEAEKDTEHREKELQEILEIERNLERTLRYEEYKMDTRAEAIVVDIYKRCNQMKAELRLREQPRLDRICKERICAEKHVQDMKLAQDAAVQAKDKASDHEYLEQHENLLGEIRALVLSDNVDISQSDRIAGVTTFEPYPSELMEIKLGRLVSPDKTTCYEVPHSTSVPAMASDYTVNKSPKNLNSKEGNKFLKDANKSSKDGRVKLGPFRLSLVKRSKSTSSVETGIKSTVLTTSPSTPVSPNNYIETTSSVSRASPTVKRNRNAKLMCQFGNFEIARGITTTADQKSLVIVDHSKKAIQTYGVVGDELKQKSSFQLSLDNKHYPWDVAVTPDGKFLIARETGVEVYSTIGQYETTIRTDPVEADMSSGEGLSEGIRCVTTTTYGRILVGNVLQSTVTVFSSAKIVIKVIQVGIEPWHLASNGTNVAFSLLRSSKICVVNIDTEEEVLAFQVDGGPRGLLYDQATGSLFVSSWERQSVEQYCSTTGEWLGTVASGLNCPDGLVMTSKGRLAVADTTDVKVYRVV